MITLFTKSKNFFSFITQKIVHNVIDTLVRALSELQLDQQESCILKAVLLLNTDSIREDVRLSTEAEKFVSKMRDRVHAALYQHCTNASSNSNHHSVKESAGDGSSSLATLRFAKLLHLLPKLTVACYLIFIFSDFFNSFLKTM